MYRSQIAAVAVSHRAPLPKRRSADRRIDIGRRNIRPGGRFGFAARSYSDGNVARARFVALQHNHSVPKFIVFPTRRMLRAVKAVQRLLVPRSPPLRARAAAPAPARDASATPAAAPAAPAATPTPTAAPARTPSASFTARHFSFGGARHAYRLYLPPPESLTPGCAPPLVLMLHGCKQDAADFARGTAMNEHAARHGCIVVYPEQPAKANGLRCWNWFEPAHQARDGGEPAWLAALAQKVAQREGADPARVYVAGLSAGGAMAAVLAHQYPDLFAAVGVHSGLMHGAAHNVIAAFGAMRNGARAPQAANAPVAVPTIVFHGSADETVHPRNGEQVVDAAVRAFARQGHALAVDPSAEEPPLAMAPARPAVRTRYRDAQGRVQVESWQVDAAPHAWSGGRAEGSYTDPRGPDASAAMLEFMLGHRRSPVDAPRAAA